MISVIVPVLNAASHLPQVIAALESQDFPADQYELFFVDNGSTDESVRILSQHPRVRQLHEPRRGSYAARNRAAMYATGDILAFTDADRIVSRTWLRAITDEFAASQAAVLLGQSRPINDTGLTALLADYENEKASYVCQHGTARQQVAYTGNMALRRATWDDYGPFVDLLRGADVVFVRRVIEGESYGSVSFCEQMLDHHLEIKTSWDCFRKMFLYGKSIRTYSRVIPADPLALEDRVAIALRCAHRNGYSWFRAARLGIGLVIGFIAYEAGFLLGARNKMAEVPAIPIEARVRQPETAPGSLSIILEWENVLLSGEDRGRAALDKIAREVRDLITQRPIEVIVVCCGEEVDSAAVERVITEVFPEGMARVLSTTAQGYYGLKNIAAEASTSDILVFSDSDTHVEEGWLAHLSDPFADPSIAAVAGSSYVQPTTWLGRAFGAFWFFPLRSGSTRLERAKGIFANNFAVRRDIFLRVPFPSIPGSNRGACVRWLERMTELHLIVVHNPSARTAHPPPNGFAHFFVRALTHGRDAILLARHQGRRLEGGAFGTVLRFAYGCFRTTTNTWHRRCALHLRPSELIPTLMTGYAYYSVCLTGELLTFLWPDWMSRRFRI